jgi:hypothetical protein
MTFRAALAALLLNAGATVAFTHTVSFTGTGTSFPLRTAAETSALWGTRTRTRGYEGASSSRITTHSATSLNVDASVDASITPDGFGLSTPASRILAVSGRNNGYYKAKASDIVSDVMEGITSGKADVAVVFGDDDSSKVAGIFTEKDYIKVGMDLSSFLYFNCDR